MSFLPMIALTIYLKMYFQAMSTPVQSYLLPLSPDETETADPSTSKNSRNHLW